ncbi:hypothetical protein [Wolbachia endosymbiont (group B) of Germaria angustata]|uniref:hypothetical protein n=1 Tax=Wolbachia endosymbiont (group B) of Germaria angustata TaxID=3077916 RepID=UPI003132FD0A
MNNQQTPAEETFTKDSPQSATPSSSGYSSLNTPSSRRSSLSISSEFNGEDETFESNTFDEEENKQEGNELEDRIRELEEENTYLKEQSAKLKKHNTRITEEGDEELNKLTKEKQDLEKEVTRLKDELKRKEKELAEKDKDIEQLAQKVTVLEQSQKNKNVEIIDLTNQLNDKESEIQSTNRINEEQQEKLEQSKAKLSALEKKNANLENDLKKTLAEGLKDNHEKQLLEELTEEKGKNNTLAKEMKQLSQEFNELKKRNENLEREIWQLKSGKSLADEMSEVTTKVATSTQTEVEYESRGIEASDHETTVPKTQDHGTNAGVNASSSTDQKKTKEMEVQTEEQVIDLYNKEGKYVRTELSDPKSTPAEIPKNLFLEKDEFLLQL